jgi:hypothetical protein
VTVFSVRVGGVLSGTTSYALPSGSFGPYSVAFLLNGSYLATANWFSSNVTVFSVGVGGVLIGAASYALPSGPMALGQ